jgi:arylsulfatase A-like enzyme
MHDRWTRLWTVCGLLLACSCSPPSTSPSTSADGQAQWPPTINKVVLISLDTLRADHLGAYGYSRNTSPSIDAFARESFVFDRTLAPAPNTPPSQMSMMTSLYPGRHGFTGNNDALAPEIETLAQRLRKAGLQTAGFVDGGFLSAEFGFARGFDVYDDEGGGLAEILPRAIRWLDTHDEDPFFLFLHTYDIHAPYISPAPFDGMFHETPYDGDVIPTSQRLAKLFMDPSALTPEILRHFVDSYDEGIRYADSKMGDLIRYLDQRGRLEDTLVIITSDHGEEFGEHGSVIHWQLYYQPNLRVPLIVRPPGGARTFSSVEGNGRIDRSPTDTPVFGRNGPSCFCGRTKSCFDDDGRAERRNRGVSDWRA